jgi:hypothetical protein
MGWVWSGGSNLAPGPLGSVVGRPAPGLAPLPLLRTGGCRPGLRPRVFPAHRPVPQLQVQDSVMGRRPIVGIVYIQTGTGFLLQAIFAVWLLGLVPIQTGAPA